MNEAVLCAQVLGFSLKSPMACSKVCKKRSANIFVGGLNDGLFKRLMLFAFKNCLNSSATNWVTLSDIISCGNRCLGEVFRKAVMVASGAVNFR